MNLYDIIAICICLHSMQNKSCKYHNSYWTEPLTIYLFFFLYRTGLSEGSNNDSRLDEIDTFISTHYYQEDGQERPNMIFSVIGDSNNIVPKIWPKSRLQESLTNAARAAGSMRIKINYDQFRRDRFFFFLLTFKCFRLPHIERLKCLNFIQTAGYYHVVNPQRFPRLFERWLRNMFIWKHIPIPWNLPSV